MGITKDQLVNAITKVKAYTNDALNSKIKVATDFTSSSGFGNARVNDGNFQYYDESSTSWKDSVDTQSSIKLNIHPQPMNKFRVRLNGNNNTFELMWQEPDDTVIDGQLVCAVDKVIIVRKKDSVPESPTDGTVVITINRGDFGTHADSWYSDTSVTPQVGDIYYYKAFPYSNNGICGDCSLNEVKMEYIDYEFYGFKIDQSESNPDSMITYLEGVNNTDYTPAAMNYTTGVFDYGDWKDAWFIKNCKPCMLKYDGTVDYYLDPDDYTKKEDGTDSDIANTSYEGNAMVEFPKVYWKIKDNGDDTANIYVSAKKVDDTYHCYAHIDANGDEIDYTYLPIYNGSIVDDKLRSMSGLTDATGKNVQTYIDYSKANNPTDIDMYNIETFSERQMLSILLILISKTVNSSKAFGIGVVKSTSPVALKTGTMNDKGMFYGTSGTTLKGVKVFGMENLWGNQNKFIVGLIRDSNGIQKVKMYKTDGNSDDYNLTGDGYHEIGALADSDTAYMSKMFFDIMCFLPKTLSGSSSTYYTTVVRAPSNTSVATVGGPVSIKCSRLLSIVYATTSVEEWSYNAALSCKPLADTEK